MLDKIEEFFIKRYLKKRQITINNRMSLEEKDFCKVLNTLRENKIMVLKKEDGIYIRLAGGESNMINMQDFVKVTDFNKK